MAHTTIEAKAIRVLERVRDFHPQGIREGKLPYNDQLVMHRLTQRGFLKVTGVVEETGECLFEITKEGTEEAEKGTWN
jgi:hypothetical protein